MPAPSATIPTKAEWEAAGRPVFAAWRTLAEAHAEEQFPEKETWERLGRPSAERWKDIRAAVAPRPSFVREYGAELGEQLVGPLREAVGGAPEQPLTAGVEAEPWYVKGPVAAARAVARTPAAVAAMGVHGAQALALPGVLAAHGLSPAGSRAESETERMLETYSRGATRLPEEVALGGAGVAAGKAVGRAGRAAAGWARDVLGRPMGDLRFNFAGMGEPRSAPSAIVRELPPGTPARIAPREDVVSEYARRIQSARRAREEQARLARGNLPAAWTEEPARPALTEGEAALLYEQQTGQRLPARMKLDRPRPVVARAPQPEPAAPRAATPPPPPPPVTGAPGATPAPISAAQGAPQPLDEAASAALIARAGEEGAAPARDVLGHALSYENVDEAARRTSAVLSEILEPRMEVARGRRSWDTVDTLADELGLERRELRRSIGVRARGPISDVAAEDLKRLIGASKERLNRFREAFRATPEDAQRASFLRDGARHAALLEELASAKGEAGRALAIWRKLSAPADISERNWQRMYEAIGGAEAAQEKAAMLAEIDPADTAAVNRFLMRMVRREPVETLRTYFINNILSNPRSQLRNIVANIGFIGIAPIEREVAGLVGSARRALGGTGGVRPGEGGAMLYSLGRGLQEGWRQFAYVLRTGVTGATKAELPARMASGPVVRFMAAADAFSGGTASAMERSALAYRGVRAGGGTGKTFAERLASLEADPAIQAAARKFGAVRTYTDPSGPALSHLLSIRDRTSMRYVLPWIVPFVKTPAKEAAAALARAPGINLLHVVRAVAKKEAPEVLDEAVARAALAAGIGGTIAYYAAQDRITASAPEDPAARDAFYAQGRLPWAVRIGDRWRQYTGLGPLSMVTGMVAYATRRAMDAGEAPDERTVSNVLTAIPAYLLDQTFLSSFADFTTAMADEDGYSARRFITRLAQGFVPASGALRFAAQVADPAVRQPTSIAEGIREIIPGASQSLLPRRTVYGEEITRPQDVASQLGFRSTEAIASPLVAEDVELGRTQGFPARDIGGVKMTPQEYNELLARTGQAIRRARERAQAAPEWRRMNPEARARVLEGVDATARTAVRFALIRRMIASRTGPERQQLIDYVRSRIGGGR